MKINSDSLEALLRQQEQAPGQSRKTSGQAGSFEAALVEQLGRPSTTDKPAGPLPPGAAQAGLISQMLISGVEESSATNPENLDDSLMQDAFTQASGTLDLWDSYVKTLGQPESGASLRDAYALLQGIDGKVSQLKQGTADVRGKSPGLDSLLNELEVLTATEKVKFNRGDYNA